MAVRTNEDLCKLPSPGHESLVRYKRPKRVLPEKKQVVSHYSHITDYVARTSPERASKPDEILTTIFPPRFQNLGGKPFKQEVDNEPAVHWDDKDLHTHLQSRLREMAVEEEESTTCPKKSALFDDCFDEVLRQVTVNMGERGMLLKRLLDELRLTLGYYRQLYVSATKFAIHKAVLAAKEEVEMEKIIKRMERAMQELIQDIEQLIVEEEREEREFAETMEAEEKDHATRCFMLRRQCRVLEAQIRTKVIARAQMRSPNRKEISKTYKQKLFKGGIV